MAGSSEPAFSMLDIEKELLLYRLFIYFATAPFLSILIFQEKLIQFVTFPPYFLFLCYSYRKKFLYISGDYIFVMKGFYT